MTQNVTDAKRQAIRDQFPSLAGDVVYLENAGGSQAPRSVIDGVTRYMRENYVQLGAGYALSQKCTQIVDEAHAFVAQLMNAGDGHVALGSSTTALLTMLSDCYRPLIKPGDEIIVAESGHEANVGPWKKLQAAGAELKWWRVDPQTSASPIEGLAELLNPKTRLLAFPHVSNLLGDIEDVAQITRMAHAVGAKVVVDGVAYAPHRAIDVSGWNVDWYAYSTYKVYGPHMAALYGSREAFSELSGPNHFFIPEDEIPYKFELGGPSHEGCAGILGLAEYLAFLADVDDPATLDRAGIESAFDLMTQCELPLQARLVSYLEDLPRVRIIGPHEDDASRVGTISFVHETQSSREVTEGVDKSNIAIRYGHMYAYHLCEVMGLEPEDGVVRVSLVHYNTMDEIDRLIEVFDALL
ncbi:MAG: cysteine desulfurase-like protein [bacterium]|nr:cysteine desulfurase-like protein [bacterium]